MASVGCRARGFACWLSGKWISKYLSEPLLSFTSLHKHCTPCWHSHTLLQSLVLRPRIYRIEENGKKSLRVFLFSWTLESFLPLSLYSSQYQFCKSFLSLSGAQQATWSVDQRERKPCVCFCVANSQVGERRLWLSWVSLCTLPSKEMEARRV